MSLAKKLFKMSRLLKMKSEADEGKRSIDDLLVQARFFKTNSWYVLQALLEVQFPLSVLIVLFASVDLCHEWYNLNDACYSRSAGP